MAEKKVAAKKPAAKKPAEKESKKVYHLTKRKEDDMWAITFVGGEKAVKLFKTKKEAEEYLEVLSIHDKVDRSSHQYILE